MEPRGGACQKIAERTLGPWDTGSSLADLASLAYSRGQDERAEDLYSRALQLLERSLGPDNPRIAPTIVNLSLVKRRLEKYAEAEALYRRALALQQGVLDPDHPEMARVLGGLAEVLRLQGKDEEAEALTRHEGK